MPSPNSSRRSALATERKMVAHTESGAALTEIVLSVFRLNGALLEVADILAAPAKLTAARWQVLAAVAEEPQSVAAISRQMGLTRQGVQRVADILAREGFAEYGENPAHQRAKLLRINAAGTNALRLVGRRQRVWANKSSSFIPVKTLRACGRTLKQIIEQVEKMPLVL